MSHFAKRHYEAIAQAIQEAQPGDPATIENVIRELARTFARDNGSFDRSRFERACVPGANVRARGAKVKTRYSYSEGKRWRVPVGESCSCRPGVERDNCPACEGTGQRIDFRKFHKHGLSGG